MEDQQTSNSGTWRGIFTIPPTPFDEQGEIDVDSLRSAVEFSVEVGSHGIVHPVMASSFFTLSDAERLEMIPSVVRQVDGRCPVVIGVSGVCTQSSVAFARAAREAGADAVIAMPPYIQRYSDDDILRHFEAISDVAGLPIFVQNADNWHPVNLELLLRLAREVEHVHYVKEEVRPAHHSIGAIIEADEPNIWGVFGGDGCANLFVELRRGAVGNMPAADFADICVQMFNLYDSGKTDEAEAMHRRLMPLIQRSGPWNEVLAKRGIIRCAKTRALETFKPVDDQDRRERDAFWPELEAAFTWQR
jgi:4-hydroxy-tetrahydrodipicolinate synthase